MTTYYVGGGTYGAVEFVPSAGYSLGMYMVPLWGDAGTNYLVARKYVWECTTAGTSDSVNPTWPATVTTDVTTVTSGGAVFTARLATSKASSTRFLLYALLMADTAGDVIKVYYASSEYLTADTSYTALEEIFVISCDFAENGEPPRPAWPIDNSAGWNGMIGHDTLNRTITIGGSFKTYWYGLWFNVAGSTSDLLKVGGSDNGDHVFEACTFQLYNTNTSAYIILGNTATNNLNSSVELRRCTLRTNNASQSIRIGANVRMIGGVLTSSVDPTAVFRDAGANDSGGGTLYAEGVDMSLIGNSGTYIVGQGGSLASSFTFVDCKLPGTMAGLYADQAIPNRSGITATFYNCASAGIQYAFAHYNALGSTEAVTTLYANDGAEYNANGDKFSWKISTTANASAAVPYTSPDVFLYTETLSAQTPYFEILRDGSTTPYTDAEVWGEWRYPGSTLSPITDYSNDRQTLANRFTGAAPANQDAGVGLAGWTGEAASAWSGKLVSPSITPYANGVIAGRVNVALPSTVLYVDPQVRV